MLHNGLKIRIRHFHTDDHKIALTVASMPAIDNPETYLVGMALCHKDDHGSRRKGRDKAIERLMGDRFTRTSLTPAENQMLFWKLNDIEWGRPTTRKWSEYRQVFFNVTKFVQR